MTQDHPDDFDSPWKEALERSLPDFLALFFPTAHAGIDWTRGYRFRDKELQKVVRDAEFGRRYADKLAEVYTLDGAKAWVLVHIEIQGQPDPAFAERMYVYHYRLFDRYRRDVVSLAVLTDPRAAFAHGYERERWGCSLRFRFPTVKLLDWRDRAAALEADRNPFALVALAHLQALAHRGPARKGALSEETGQRYRLPTEAEWEFAARAGTRSAFAFGEAIGCRDVHFNSLFPYAERRERRKWYVPLCIPTPRPLDVGSFQPNLWGLYDMHGNVQEFTSSPWRDSHVDLPRNGVYRRTGNEEWVVVKGGSWFDPAVACRSAARRRRHVTEIDTNLGFRVLREL
jgi:hypothetical protein